LLIMTHIFYAKSSGLGGGELGLRKRPGPEFASILATLYLILLFFFSLIRLFI
jgi:hypothetical protein